MDLIISDLHINHTNIIKYENRPFDSVKSHDDFIINEWNNVVKENDRVFILGDIMFSGNHDQPLVRETNKFNRFNDKIYIAPNIFEPKVFIDNSKKPEKVVMCHYPMLSWNASYHGRKLFYGHVHSNTPSHYNDGSIIIKDDKLPSAYNVSADLLGFVPKSFQEVIKMNQ